MQPSILRPYYRTLDAYVFSIASCIVGGDLLTIVKEHFFWGRLCVKIAKMLKGIAVFLTLLTGMNWLVWGAEDEYPLAKRPRLESVPSLESLCGPPSWRQEGVEDAFPIIPEFSMSMAPYEYALMKEMPPNVMASDDDDNVAVQTSVDENQDVELQDHVAFGEGGAISLGGRADEGVAQTQSVSVSCVSQAAQTELPEGSSLGKQQEQCVGGNNALYSSQPPFLIFPQYYGGYYQSMRYLTEDLTMHSVYVQHMTDEGAECYLDYGIEEQSFLFGGLSAEEQKIQQYCFTYADNCKWDLRVSCSHRSLFFRQKEGRNTLNESILSIVGDKLVHQQCERADEILAGSIVSLTYCPNISQFAFEKMNGERIFVEWYLRVDEIVLQCTAKTTSLAVFCKTYSEQEKARTLRLAEFVKCSVPSLRGFRPPCIVRRSDGRSGMTTKYFRKGRAAGCWRVLYNADSESGSFTRLVDDQVICKVKFSWRIKTAHPLNIYVSDQHYQLYFEPREAKKELALLMLPCNEPASPNAVQMRYVVPNSVLTVPSDILLYYTKDSVGVVMLTRRGFIRLLFTELKPPKMTVEFLERFGWGGSKKLFVYPIPSDLRNSGFPTRLDVVQQPPRSNAQTKDCVDNTIYKIYRTYREYGYHENVFLLGSSLYWERQSYDSTDSFFLCLRYCAGAAVEGLKFDFLIFTKNFDGIKNIQQSFCIHRHEKKLILVHKKNDRVYTLLESLSEASTCTVHIDPVVFCEGKSQMTLQVDQQPLFIIKLLCVHAHFGASKVLSGYVGWQLTSYPQASEEAATIASNIFDLSKNLNSQKTLC